jgi:hypothetical protein
LGTTSLCLHVQFVASRGGGAIAATSITRCFSSAVGAKQSKGAQSQRYHAQKRGAVFRVLVSGDFCCRFCQQVPGLWLELAGWLAGRLAPRGYQGEGECIVSAASASRTSAATSPQSADSPGGSVSSTKGSVIQHCCVDHAGGAAAGGGSILQPPPSHGYHAQQPPYLMVPLQRASSLVLSQQQGH